MYIMHEVEAFKIHVAVAKAMYGYERITPEQDAKAEEVAKAARVMLSQMGIAEYPGDFPSREADDVASGLVR